MTAPAEPTTALTVTAGAATVGTTASMATVTTEMLVAAYGQQVARLRESVLAAVVRFWRSLGSWRDADADRYVETMIPFIAAGQEQAARLTAAYLQQVGTLRSSPPFRPVAPGGRRPSAQLRNIRNTRNAGVPTTRLTLPEVDTRSLRGVDAPEVYRRPFVTTWTELARGKPLTEAVAAGERRAVDIAGTDLQLAKTHTARAVLADDPAVVGYRRVLKGEYSCAKCVLASTVRYRKNELMPLHPGCDCDVEPVYGDKDPGKVLDRDVAKQIHEIVRRDLGKKYVKAGGRGEVDYRDIIVTHEHGELGPVLAVRGQKFTGPGSVS